MDYFNDQGTLLYSEGKGGNLALVVISGTGSLDDGCHITNEVNISINPAGLTNEGQKNIMHVAELKLRNLGYSHLTLTRTEHIVPTEDWSRAMRR